MSAALTSCMVILDQPEASTPIKAKWTADGRFVSVTVEGLSMLFNPAAFERFRAALAAVDVSAPSQTRAA